MANKKFENSSAVIEAVQEMNSVTGNINLRTELLDDISTKLFHLMDDMDKAAYNGHEKLYFKEHQQEVRVLATFMNYVMKDLKKDTEDIVSLGENLHEEVVKKAPSLG